MNSHRFLIRLLGVALFALASVQAHADWPERPVSLVVPWPPGGSTDTMVRTIAPLLSAELGQPVVVVNRPGASGNLGAEFVLRQPADGYNIFFGAASHLIGSALYENAKEPLRYDVVNDFKYPAAITDSRMVVVVNPKVPANTIGELRELAKTREMTYASSGSGSIQHLSAELFLRTTGIRMLHVPYKGIAPSLNDLMAGVVDASVESLYPVQALIKAGKLKALAVLTPEPVAALPGVATAASQGFPGLQVSAPQFVGVPKGTPDDIVARISQVFRTVYADPEVVRKLEGAGLVVRYLPREEATRVVRDERAKWAKLIREAGIKPD